MVKRTFLVVLLTLLLSSTASALTVDDVIYMSSAGVEDSIIIAKIDASGVYFDLSTQEIVELWEAGVSPNVIEHMINTAAGMPEVGDYEGAEDEYEYYDEDDDIVVVRDPRSRVHLYFGFGYYDSWYYPYWWWHRPFYYDIYYSSFYHHWPYYYHWNPYAYYYPWDCWAYRHGCNIIAGRGIRHQWRRLDPHGDGYAGMSGYRLKPRYSYTGGGRGGYLASDGRYVFPKDRTPADYAGGRTGYRKPLASDDRSGRSYRGRTYDKNRGYVLRSDRPGYSRSARTKALKGQVTRGRVTKDRRDLGTRLKSSQSSRKSKPSTVTRSRSSGTTQSKGSSVHSSRPRSGGTRGSIGGSRSSGSRGSASGSSSGSGSRGSSRGSRGGRSR